MFIDVCKPEGNEEKFIKIAEELGTHGLLFLHKKPENLEKLQKTTKVKLFSVKQNDFAKGTRANVENKQKKFLYGFENQEEKDSLHYKRSGINQIIAKLLKQKDKVFVVDMEKILESKEPERLLGRLQQNLMFVKKHKIKVAICSLATKPENLRSEKDYEALLRTLGYQEEAKKAVKTLGELFY